MIILSLNSLSILLIIYKSRIKIYSFFFIINSYSSYIIILFDNLTIRNKIILFCLLSYYINLIQLLVIRVF